MSADSATANIVTPAATQIMIPAIAEDGSYFPIEKLQAHTQAVFHLAVSVFVFDAKSRELLIQRRAQGKYHCGGLWANTCCTHPHWDEPMAASAARRLREEMGFAVPLREERVVEYSADCGNGLHEHERVTFYTGVADKADLAVPFNLDEVDAARWVSWETLCAEAEATPEAFAPWFRIYIERFPRFAF